MARTEYAPHGTQPLDVIGPPGPQATNLKPAPGGARGGANRPDSSPGAKLKRLKGFQKGKKKSRGKLKGAARAGSVAASKGTKRKG